MSSKTRKSAASTPQQSAGASTSQSRKSTPLSPARVTRMEEKIQLQNLNDRLATYIDKVRYLEAENNLLGGQVTTIQEKYETEIKNSKEQYFTEISGLRSALDSTSKEKAQALIELNNLKNNINDLQKKLHKKERDLSSAEKTINNLESHNQELQNKVNHLQSDYKKLEESYKEADEERRSLSAMLDEIRELYDSSMLRITDLENKMQSMKEEITFKETVYEKELSDSRMLKTVEISGIDASIREDYDQKLADSLRELREQYESQMLANKDELEAMYQKQMSDLSRSCESKVKAAQGKEEESRTVKTKVEYLSSKVSELETLNEGLRNRIKDLELMIEQEREWNAIKLNEKDEENRKLREESQVQLAEYQDLLGIKVALDMEIAAYRKLLEGEEARLHISHEESGSGESMMRGTPVRQTPLRTAKRKRAHFETGEKTSSDLQVTASSKSDVEIADHDMEGKYIKLHNKGNTEVPLGGWQLIRKTGDQEILYKFNRTSIIKPNTYITVWSSDANVTHNPPNDYVMRGQKWFVADTMSSVLLNNNGEEMAVRETSKKVFRSMEQRVLESGSYSPEELYHQQGDFKERCAIM